MITVPQRRISMIVQSTDKERDELNNNNIFQKYAEFKKASTVVQSQSTELEEDISREKRRLAQRQTRLYRQSCHLAAYRGDISFVKDALVDSPSLIEERMNYSEQSLLSPAELSDPYYLPPAQVPRLVRGALQVGNPARMSVDQRWLLTHSFAECSLLHYACAGDQLQMVRFLLSQGADRNAVNLASKEPDYYTTDDNIRDLLWSSEPRPRVIDRDNAASAEQPCPPGGLRRIHRGSIFSSSNSGNAATGAATTTTTTVAEPIAAPTTLTAEGTTIPARAEAELAGAVASRRSGSVSALIAFQGTSAAGALFSENDLSVPGTVHRNLPPPPPPPPPPSISPPVTATVARPVIAPPRSLPPPPAHPPTTSSSSTAGRPSISQLIERTRRSIKDAAAAAAASDTTSIGTVSVAASTGRPSFNARRLSRVMQSRRHRDSRTEEPREESELPMLELPPPGGSFSRPPLVMRRLSVVPGGGELQDQRFLVDGEEGGFTECKEQSGGEESSRSPSQSPPKSRQQGSSVTQQKSEQQAVALSKLHIPQWEVDGSAAYLEAWEKKASTGRGGADPHSTMAAAMYDSAGLDSGIKGAKEAAKLFARARAIEREEARAERRKETMLRIFKKMPPIETLASQMVRQHNSGLSTMEVLFRSPEGNGDCSVLDTYQRALDDALADCTVCAEEDGSNGSVDSPMDKRRGQPKLNMQKLTFREMIWCRAGMGMNILGAAGPGSATETRNGDDVRMRLGAYKHGVRLMRREFQSYAFRDRWEAVEFYERKEALLRGLGMEAAAAVIDASRSERPHRRESVASCSDGDASNCWSPAASVDGDSPDFGGCSASDMVEAINGGDYSMAAGDIDDNGNIEQEHGGDDTIAALKAHSDAAVDGHLASAIGGATVSSARRRARTTSSARTTGDDSTE